MKAIKLFAYTCSLILACMFNACSDDDNPVVPDIPQGLELTLTPLDVTVSTFDFEVEANREDISYVCLYVPRSIIDRVPKYDLPDYLMDDLRKQAEQQGKPFAQYLSEISYQGNQEFHLESLMRGTLYEIVAFAVKDEWKADEAEYLFFHTLKATPTDCTFRVEADEEPNVFTVTPSDKNVKYYLAVMSRTDYETNVANGFDDTSIVFSLMNMQIEAGYNEAYEDGILTDKEAQEVIDGLFWQGDQRLRGDFLPDTEYRWFAAAFDQFEWELILTSEVQSGYFVPNASTGADTRMQSLPATPWRSQPLGEYLPVARPCKAVNQTIK